MSNIPFESFIHQTYIDDLDLCDDIIQFYHDTPHKSEGTFGPLSLIDKSRKDTVETTLNYSPELCFRYIEELKKSLHLYIEKYETCNWCEKFGIVENINIQHYKPGSSYSAWHAERSEPNNDRHLVFMTYLNDVTDQGGTEFYNQKLITEPRKGLTLIWPVDWTHTHRGIASPTQDKYIVTGWLNYVERQK